MCISVWVHVCVCVGGGHFTGSQRQKVTLWTAKFQLVLLVLPLACVLFGEFVCSAKELKVFFTYTN